MMKIDNLPDKIHIIYKAFTRKTLEIKLKEIDGLCISSIDKYKKGVTPTPERLKILARLVNLHPDDIKADVSSFIDMLITKNKFKKNCLRELETIRARSQEKGKRIYLNSMSKDAWMDSLIGNYILYHNCLSGNGNIVRAHMELCSVSEDSIELRCQWKLHDSDLFYTGSMFKTTDRFNFILERDLWENKNIQKKNRPEIVYITTNKPYYDEAADDIFLHGIIVAGDESKDSLRSIPATSKVLIIRSEFDPISNAPSQYLGSLTKDELRNIEMNNNYNSNSLTTKHKLEEIFKYIKTTNNSTHVLRSFRPPENQL